MDQKFSKKKQLAYKNKKQPKPEGWDKENPVQKFAEHYLELKGIAYIRIPDELWMFLMSSWSKAPEWLKKLCSKYLAGWSDLIPIIPITDKYGLVCLIECKSKKGKLHGKQKRMARELNYQIIRNDEQTIKEVNDFIKFSDDLKDKLKNE